MSAGPGTGSKIEVEDRLSVEVVIAAVPELADFMPKVRPDWNDLVEVAEALIGHYEISRRNWQRATTLLGRHGAALAFAVMAHHHGRGLVASPGGYFHAMLERAATGDLDLIRSYHGMRARSFGAH